MIDGQERSVAAATGARGVRAASGRTGSITGLAVAAAVGGTAALSWSLWIWLAFAVPSPATEPGPVLASGVEGAR